MKQCIIVLVALFVFSEGRAAHTSTTIPFEVVGKLIVVEGDIKGRRGAFILDTGASGLILNRKYFSGKQDKNLVASGISGSNAGLESTWVRFSLGSLEWKNEQAAILSLEYLEQAKGIRILGLIGSRLFWRHSMQLDFQNKLLRISRMNRSDRPEYGRNGPPDQVLKFKLKGGIPLLQLDVAGYPMRFGLDTGAETNLFREQHYFSLLPYLSGIRKIAFRGISRRSQVAPGGQLSEITIGSLSCRPMWVLFTDLNYVNRTLPGERLDGILGHEFLRQFNIIINFRDRQILLWENNSPATEILAPRE